MYKVFINDKTIYIVKNVNQDFVSSDSLIYHYRSKKELKSVITDFQHSETCKKLILYNKNINILFKKVISLYKIIEAAGGLVRNSKGEILFIYRMGKWDLPKGKIEKNEKIKATAIREVEEECGISKLTILRYIQPTYHIYFLKGQQLIKKSYWYEMKCNDNKIPFPQIKEGITAARWIGMDELDEILDNAYLSVKELVVNYLRK